MYTNSKTDIRLEAVRIASTLKDITTEDLLIVAENIAAYIIGSADIPEHYDANGYFKELIEASEIFKQTAEKDFTPTIASGIHPETLNRDDD